MAEADGPMGYAGWLNLLVTGDRTGAQLDGMVLDRDAAERWFDATFEATLVSASDRVTTDSTSSPA